MHERIKRALGIGHTDDGTEFPPAIPRQRQRFNIGDRVIVTTRCEDISLHELVGTVVSLPSGQFITYGVSLDAHPDTTMPFLPEEIGVIF